MKPLIKLTITKDELYRRDRAERREKAREAGFYDGRNAKRVEPDHKKQLNKKVCRMKTDFHDYSCVEESELSININIQEGEEEECDIEITNSRSNGAVRMSINSDHQGVEDLLKELRIFFKRTLI
jgi:hypothetical protein